MKEILFKEEEHIKTYSQVAIVNLRLNLKMNNLMADQHNFVQPANQIPLNVNYIEMLKAAMNGNGIGFSSQDMQRVMMQMQMNGMANVQVENNKIQVTWRDLVYKVKIGFLARIMNNEKERVKVILKGLSGHFRGGELTAIMGEL